ncbi:MAG: zinc-finger domain-containing protein [Alphaproteobacteria bacterium]|nr:zinc-finger domain-containing protein [Alphaproteobacteria bacterium]
MRHGEPIETKDVVVRCDGGGEALGHPAIFLNLTPKEEIVCPYCSRYFVEEGKNKPHKKMKKSNLMRQITLYLYLLTFLGVSFGGAIALGNPASKNCIEKGGTLRILKRGDGAEYGVCFFEDNRQCEEWALLRGNCRVGGIKITGYTTPEAVYCAIIGGTVSSDQNLCTFAKNCPVGDLYNGKCSP